MYSNGLCTVNEIRDRRIQNEKNMRIFLSIMMLVVFVFGMETYAADTEVVLQENVPSKKVSFEEMVNDQMRHADSLFVENMEGEEITNEFIETAQKYISEGNYDALKEYMYSTVNTVKYRIVNGLKKLLHTLRK